ncbi:MAG: polyprenyl diphosphate synthase [Ketobacteraceae bacterium]|nr:polyprenyl diphosphate synthase [Ketobacteraceae bacterium]
MDSHQGNVPRHVAIIMDGNNRWAKQRGLRGVEGHKAGADTVKATVEACARAGVEVLTVFAFSSENWRRPQEEVNALMELFLEALNDEVPELHDNGIRLLFVGNLSGFSDKLQSQMQAAMNLTAGNRQMTFAVAVNYGGQWDIANAARQLARRVADGEISPDDINTETLGARMCLADYPPLDLMIRTGGERRISNFLLWQVAYAELYFSDLYWPDFNADALHAAFADYATRQRRFGRTGEQVESGQ